VQVALPRRHRGCTHVEVAREPADDEVRAGLVEHADHALVRLRKHRVVGVHERDQLTARVPDAQVARSAEPAVGSRHHPDVGEAVGVVARNRGGPVGRTVVDHDDLEVAVGLREDAVDGLGQVVLDVEGGHDHAQPGSSRGLSPQRLQRPNRALS
jgi:hypothetical protein